jgi:hypothetical protein
VTRFPKLGQGKLVTVTGLTAAVTLATACSQFRTPVTAPASASQTSVPQLGGPATGINAGSSGYGVVGGGSFPRSFLIPGTETSIRIGG